MKGIKSLAILAFALGLGGSAPMDAQPTIKVNGSNFSEVRFAPSGGGSRGYIHRSQKKRRILARQTGRHPANQRRSPR